MSPNLFAKPSTALSILTVLLLVGCSTNVLDPQSNQRWHTASPQMALVLNHSSALTKTDLIERIGPPTHQSTLETSELLVWENKFHQCLGWVVITKGAVESTWVGEDFGSFIDPEDWFQKHVSRLKVENADEAERVARISAHTNWPADIRKAALEGEVAIGMNGAALFLALGRPAKVNTTKKPPTEHTNNGFTQMVSTFI